MTNNGRKPNIRTKRKVARHLVSYAKKLDWARPTDKSRKFSGFAANTFLLGVMLDRNVVAQRAWDAGEWINESLGDYEDVSAVWGNILALDSRRLVGFMRYGYGGRAFHRHYKRMAQSLRRCAETILDQYSGDPRRIWNVQRDVAQVRLRLEELAGIGPALSRMAVLILARDYGLLGGKKALAQLDIKPDIHVRRVFVRTGLVERRASNDDLILAARQLAPHYPAALDAPAWEIGRTWCRPGRANCAECAITEACPKLPM